MPSLLVNTSWHDPIAHPKNVYDLIQSLQTSFGYLYIGWGGNKHPFYGKANYT